MSIPPSFVSALALAGLVIASAPVHAETILYATDFSDFPSGDGKLVGQDGWDSTHPDDLAHGIVDDFFGEGNRSASIGFNPPSPDPEIVTVFRPLNFDPQEENQPFVRLSTDLAIADSTNDAYDSFYISVFNRDVQLLGSVVFDNTVESFGIWRFDGFEFEDTEVLFTHGQLYHLDIEIDYSANVWSAKLDDAELFAGVPFVIGDDARRDLGDFSVEWEISNLDSPGDNWMLFDNWQVSVSDALVEPDPPLTDTPITITSIQRTRNGAIRIRWEGRINTTYQIETSRDLTQWVTAESVTTSADSPRGLFVASPEQATKSAFYRVRLP